MSEEVQKQIRDCPLLEGEAERLALLADRKLEAALEPPVRRAGRALRAIACVLHPRRKAGNGA